jgi:hypothetical protein
MKEKNKRHVGGKVSADKEQVSDKELIAGASSFTLPGEQYRAEGMPEDKRNVPDSSQLKNGN